MDGFNAGLGDSWLARRMAAVVARQYAELAPALQSAVSVFGRSPPQPAADASSRVQPPLEML